MSGFGVIEQIVIGPVEGGPTHAVERVTAHAGRGLEGDRYLRPTPSAPGEDTDEITLIEAEALDALRAEHGWDLGALEIRRNIVVRGLPLNPLNGTEFQVGGARVRAWELCEPCAYLQGMNETPGLIKALVHWGGLRGRIVAGGEIAVGDRVMPG